MTQTSGTRRDTAQAGTIHQDDARREKWMEELRYENQQLKVENAMLKECVVRMALQQTGATHWMTQGGSYGNWRSA